MIAERLLKNVFNVRFLHLFEQVSFLGIPMLIWVKLCRIFFFPAFYEILHQNNKSYKVHERNVACGFTINKTTICFRLIEHRTRTFIVYILFANAQKLLTFLTVSMRVLLHFPTLIHFVLLLKIKKNSNNEINRNGFTIDDDEKSLKTVWKHPRSQLNNTCLLADYTPNTYFLLSLYSCCRLATEQVVNQLINTSHLMYFLFFL